jgi:hypothetical protein
MLRGYESGGASHTVKSLQSPKSERDLREGNQIATSTVSNNVGMMDHRISQLVGQSV